MLWAIGVIIFIVMMAILKLWPNWEYYYTTFVCGQTIIVPVLPFNKARTKAICRIGPHNKDVLEVIICSMLGDFWADKIYGKRSDSVRFNVEQSISNSAYIHYLTLYFYNLGYCARPMPILIEKSDDKIEKRFNYRLSLFTFTSFVWIYDEFYKSLDGKNVKQVPLLISNYLSPLGLSHWIMQDGSFQKGQGINIATNSFSYQECQFLADILNQKYNLKTSVVKTGVDNQYRISIWKRSMPLLIRIVSPYIIPEMQYKLYGK